ncbi:Rz1-like lysis system protein LysC [Leminorella grimontii]|uniref:Rz1-like lysis system protein LysC n=1 Tax=Leminorella grimontii TaxID=82981 RepID=UPI0032209438
MQSYKSHWSHREPRKISKWLLQVMSALVALFLLLSIGGCENTRVVYVPVPALPLPTNLTAETPQPPIPAPLTWGGSVNLNVALLAALAQCNADKTGIREIDIKK